MGYSFTESEYLVALIKSAILMTSAPEPPSDLNWEALVKMSKEQKVYSIIASTLIPAQMPENLARELMLYNQNELVKMLAVKTEREAIEQELDKKGIKYILLKGSVLKHYYPLERMRQMCDIDILYDASRRDDINELMYSRGYELFNMDDNSDDFKKQPYYTFEFHRELFFSEHEFCPVFDYVWANAAQDSDKKCLYHMNLNDMYIYNICHMYKHFSQNCCGIRFLVDNYLFIKKENKKLNWNYIEAKLDEYGVLDFEQSARALAFSLFEGKGLTSDERKLLYLYTNFGIYGNELGHSFQEYERLKNKNNDRSKSAKIKFMLKRIFPNKKYLLPAYPFLKKMPFLLPFVYVYRFFKGIFNKRGITELETINKLED